MWCSILLGSEFLQRALKGTRPPQKRLRKKKKGKISGLEPKVREDGRKGK